MASSGSVTELIWHFAGYLKLPPADNFLIKIMFDGAAGGAGAAPEADPDSAHAQGLPAPGDLPDLDLGLPWLLPPNPYLWRLSPIHKLAPPHPHEAQHPAPSPHVPLPPFPGTSDGGDGGGGGELQITVVYQSGGDQELIDVRQINVMINDNQVNAPADAAIANNDHADHLLATMLDEAQDSVPPALDLGAATTNGLKAFVDAIDAHPLLTQAENAPYAVDWGRYVNGQPVGDGSDPHQVTDDLFNNTIQDAVARAFAGPPGLPPGDHFGQSIDHVSVGGNIAANDAVLVNDEGLSVSLAVLGDYYQTQAVVQTNVFNGIDDFIGNGATSIAQNTIANIADFQNQIPTLTFGTSGSTPVTSLTWSVDVLNGDLLQIHSLIQTNYLSNNNVIYQTSSTGESEIIAGSNTLLNTAQFQNLTANYDLIIVEGSYHQDDFIYQKNVLLDFNKITFDGSGLASQSATGGGNSLVNDASIVDTGNHDYLPFNNDVMAVIQALENQQGTVDPAAVMNAFPDLFGNIHVLVVTGDYYDVNFLYQTNIMSNANVVALSGSPSAPAGATQSVSTGDNVTVNAATIIDGGSIESPYLQGNYYNDMILIQTNIIGNDPKIAGQDPGQLVPELVAFTPALESTDQNQQTSVASPTDPQHHNDGVASVMH
ncbi:MAG: hypothetical protein IRY89_15400 [Pseudolabrys sp.]|nr:hypothetical protein [Pseudolabrys sp.]